MPRDLRRQLVDQADATIPLTRQATLLDLSRSSLYYHPTPLSETDKGALDALDAIYTAHPQYGSRRMKKILARDYGIGVGRDHVRHLMRMLGIAAVYPKSGLSKPHPEHAVYPYLLRGVPIVRPNQVWSTDITYIRLKHGFAYLVALIDWYSRYVLAWRVSSSLDLSFCLEMLDEALLKFTLPDMHNSDQGSHFTSQEYTGRLKAKQIVISMDGRGRCLDNIFVERLWRTVKYEDVFVKGYETVPEVKSGLSSYFTYYNTDRPHQSLNYETPEKIYFQKN